MHHRRVRRLEKLVARTAGAFTKPRARPLRTHQDLLDLLNEQVEEVRGQRWASPLQKARTIAILGRLARQVIAGSIVAQRVEALEAVLKHRPKPE